MTDNIENLEFSFVTITPEMAASWLERNDINRPLRPDRVTQIAQAIRRGEWKVNGDTIKINPDGQILDGQHRLWAIVESGLSVMSAVVIGLDTGAQHTVDIGARRNLSDALRLHGETNTNNLAAALNLFHLWRLGDSVMRSPHASRLTPAQAFAILEVDGPRIRDALQRASTVRSAMNKTLTSSIITCCLLRFGEIDAEDAVTFWERVGDGTGMKKNDPCYMLRESCTKNSKRRNKYPTLMMFALVIKAWNAFRSGREIQTLAWKMGGSRPEPFPEPI